MKNSFYNVLNYKISIRLDKEKLFPLSILLIPVLCFISPWLSIVFTYLFILYLIFVNDRKILLFFIYFCFMQNMILIFFANSFNSTSTTIFSLSKEIMLYLYILKELLFKNKNINSKHKNFFLFSLLFLLLLSVSFVISNASLYAKVLSIRQFLLPIICLMFGFFIKPTEKEYKHIVILGTIVAIIGIMEFFIVKDAIWLKLPMQKYQENKGTTFEFYRGVPLNYYTWDLNRFFGVVKRLVSLFADPLITGHYLFLSFILCNILKFRSVRCKLLVKLLLFVSSILTLSKGVIICYLLYVILRLIRKSDYRKIIRTSIVLLLISVISFPLLKYIANNFFPNTSIVIHLNGFLNGLKSTLFGSGIGKAGVLVNIKDEIDGLGGESYIGVLCIQLGYLGLIVFSLIMLAVILFLLKKYKLFKNNFNFIALVLVCSIFIESFFSESSIGIVGSGLYFILAGFALNNNYNKTLNMR